MLVVVLDAGGLIHCGLATVLTGINVGGLIHCGLATVLAVPVLDVAGGCSKCWWPNSPWFGH